MAGVALLAQEPGEQFKQLDKNNDGKLTQDEVPQGLEQLFNRIDTNHDGTITPDEGQAFARLRAETSGPKSQRVQALLDLPYADTENPRQKLDLYLPKNAKTKPLPVVAFIHGGAWQGGDKRGGYGMVGPLVESGDFAGVSIGYRLSGEAIWPAQIHDCKAAIRWLRGNAEKYHLDPDKIGVVGSSAGGHLVALLGAGGDASALEGSLGEHDDLSSRVTCVVDYYGPTDFRAFAAVMQNANSPVARLFGGTGKEEAAREASPVSYVSKDDPAFLQFTAPRTERCRLASRKNYILNYKRRESSRCWFP